MLPISVYSLFFIFLTLLFLFQIVFFMHSVFPVTLSLLLLCLSSFSFPVILSLCHSVSFIILSLCHSVSCHSVSFIILPLCHSVSCHSVSFHLFVALPLPYFSSSFWLHFYPFICLFFDIFAWIFKYIKILLSFYFFVCLFTLFLFSFVIYVIDFLIRCAII